jgi:hypothetical protein
MSATSRDCYEWQSGAEGSRTLDLLNAIRFQTEVSRPQLTTTAEKITRCAIGESAAMVSCGTVNP